MNDSDDVNLLVPEEESDEELQLKLQAEEIKSNILKLGITQLVFGVASIIGGVILQCSWPWRSIDYAAEGIWCGTFMVICGALGIAARFHLYMALVITCLVLNILTAVIVASGVIIDAISSISDAFNPYGMQYAAGFIALNMALVASLVMSIYLSVVFAKVLAQGKETYCCYPASNPTVPNFMMVYVPPGGQTFDSGGSAHMAVPGQATRVLQPGVEATMNR